MTAPRPIHQQPVACPLVSSPCSRNACSVQLRRAVAPSNVWTAPTGGLGGWPLSQSLDDESSGSICAEDGWSLVGEVRLRPFACPVALTRRAGPTQLPFLPLPTSDGLQRRSLAKRRAGGGA